MMGNIINAKKIHYIVIKVSMALFRFKKFLNFDTVTLLFLFNKHCSVTE